MRKDLLHSWHQRVQSIVADGVWQSRDIHIRAGQVVDNRDTDGLLAFLPSRIKFQHDFWWGTITLIPTIYWWKLGRHTENQITRTHESQDTALGSGDYYFPRPQMRKTQNLVHTKRLYKIGLTCAPPDESGDKNPHCLWVAAIVLASGEALQEVTCPTNVVLPTLQLRTLNAECLRPYPECSGWTSMMV